MSQKAYDSSAYGRGIKSPYRIDLFGDAPVVETGGELEGAVRNIGSASWGAAHAVGLHDFRDADGRLLPGFEMRARLSRSPLAAGEQALFRFDFRHVGFPSTAVSCALDIVEEHVAWLGDLGGTVVRLPVRDTTPGHIGDWLVFLNRLREAAPERSRDRIAVIGKVLRRSNVAALANVRRLGATLEAMRRNAPYQPYKPTTATVVATSRSVVPGADPRDLYYRHFAAILGDDHCFAHPDRAAALFARFVREGGTAFRHATVPLPRDLCEWLGARALPVAIARNPATRSMVAMLDDDTGFVPNPHDGGRADLWRFATGTLIDRNLAAAAVPDIVLHALARSVHETGVPGAFPPPSGFMHQLYQDDANYRGEYDLSEDWSRLAFAVDLAMLAVENEAMRSLLGSEILQWLHAPLSPTLDLSALETILLASTDRAPPRFPRSETPPDVDRLRRAIDWLSLGRVPQTPATVRIFGEYQSPTGLGVNMRMSRDAIRALGFDTEIVDAQADVLYPVAGPSDGARALARPVDLYHLNLDAVPALLCRYADAARADAYRIAFALWETSAMPEEHRAGMALVDEIWAPTKYVADVYRAAGHPNVQVVGKAIDLPDVEPIDLAAFGVPAGTTTFLMSFDIDSWIVRKNPIAAIDAFGRAFPGVGDVRLIVKTNGLYHHPGDRAGLVDRVRHAAERDPRIVLVSEMLPFRRYLGLIAAVDATVSPHRSEGFGYLSAYSLLLETPTIVTDHSGTQDFCTAETSYPVPARLVPIRPGEFVYYNPDARWADIDVDALGAAMRAVREDPAEAARRARNGRRLVSGRYSGAALAKRLLTRLDAL